MGGIRFFTFIYFLVSSLFAFAEQHLEGQVNKKGDTLSIDQERIDRGSQSLAERLVGIALCTSQTAYGSNKSSTVQWYFGTALSLWNDEVLERVSETSTFTFNQEAFEKQFEKEILRRLNVKSIPEESKQLLAALSTPLKKFSDEITLRKKKMGDTTKSMQILSPESAKSIRNSLDQNYALSKKQKVDCSGTEKKTYFWSKFNYIPDDQELSSANPEKASAEESERSLVADKKGKTEEEHLNKETPPPTQPEARSVAQEAPEAEFKEKAEAELKKIKPESEKGKNLLERFLGWMNERKLETVDDFHKITLSNLENNPNFNSMLIDRNPFGQMCTNYTELPIDKRKEILSKSFLVHLISENFDNPKTENLGNKRNDSVGPWQTAMNTSGYGCTFKNHDEIKYNVDKNIFCLMTFYSFREKHFDKIYGRSKDPTTSKEKVIGSGLHWSVLKEGSGSAFFEEKYEPLFRSATSKDCNNTYLNPTGKTVVNGHPASAVAEMIEYII